MPRHHTIEKRCSVRDQSYKNINEIQLSINIDTRNILQLLDQQDQSVEASQAPSRANTTSHLAFP